MNQFISFIPLLATVCKVVRPSKIVEYGPGNSTKCMLDNSDAVIYSYENHCDFFKQYQEKFKDNPRVILQLGDTRVGAGKKTPYVNLPLLQFGIGNIDLAFIDGRYRADCLISAYYFVKEAGVVVLHDDERPTYKVATDIFPFSFRDKNIITGVYSRNSQIIKNIEEQYTAVLNEEIIHE